MDGVVVEWHHGLYFSLGYFFGDGLDEAVSVVWVESEVWYDAVGVNKYLIHLFFLEDWRFLFLGETLFELYDGVLKSWHLFLIFFDEFVFLGNFFFLNFDNFVFVPDGDGFLLDSWFLKFYFLLTGAKKFLFLKDHAFLFLAVLANQHDQAILFWIDEALLFYTLDYGFLLFFKVLYLMAQFYILSECFLVIFL